MRIHQFGFVLPTRTTHSLQLQNHMVIKNLYLMESAQLDRVFPSLHNPTLSNCSTPYGNNTERYIVLSNNQSYGNYPPTAPITIW